MEKQKLIKLLQLVKSYAEIQEMKKTESYIQSVKERFNSLQKHEKEAFVELLKTWHAQHKIAKDDKPHAPNSPEDKAHDVVEEDESVRQALQHVRGKQGKKKALAHLRSLDDRSKHRSPKNQKLGKEESKPADQKPAAKQPIKGHVTDYAQYRKEIANRPDTGPKLHYAENGAFKQAMKRLGKEESKPADQKPAAKQPIKGHVTDYAQYRKEIANRPDTGPKLHYAENGAFKQAMKRLGKEEKKK